MQMLSIEAPKRAADIKQWLITEFQPLLTDGVEVTWDESSDKEYVRLSCVMLDKHRVLAANPMDICKYYVSSALAEYILQVLERHMIGRSVRKQSRNLSAQERTQVEEQAAKLLRGANRHVQKTKILYALLDYFDFNDSINLEGFVRFRLPEYVQAVDHAVSQALSKLEAAREYREFVHLLRYFVELHEPKTPLAHVILRSNGLFRLLDENGHTIENEYLEGFVTGLVDIRVDSEDLLLSALITTAPKRIIVHLKPKWSVTQTLVNVFADRVTICTKDCEYCRRSNEYMERLKLH